MTFLVLFLMQKGQAVQRFIGVRQDCFVLPQKVYSKQLWPRHFFDLFPACVSKYHRSGLILIKMWKKDRKNVLAVVSNHSCDWLVLSSRVGVPFSDSLRWRLEDQGISTRLFRLYAHYLFKFVNLFNLKFFVLFIQVLSAAGFKNATTKFKILDTNMATCSLLQLEPITGLKQQIRVHVAEGLKCPILGDHKFSSDIRQPQVTNRRCQFLGSGLVTTGLPTSGALQKLSNARLGYLSQ